MMNKLTDITPYFDHNESVVREDMNKVVALACKLGDITKEELFSKSRKRLIGDVRICVANLLRRVFGLNKSETGRFLNRDHASVIHYESQHEWMMKLNYYRKIYDACVQLATDRTFDSEKVLVSHYETVNKLKKENSILSRRVAELTQELKQFSAIKENILKLQN